MVRDGLYGVRSKKCVVLILDYETDNIFCQDVANANNRFWVDIQELTEEPLTPLEVLAWAAM